MAIRQVPLFMTSDEKTFDTLEEAELHELSLELDTDIDGVCSIFDISDRAKATLKKYLPLMINELGYIKNPAITTPATFEEEESAELAEAA